MAWATEWNGPYEGLATEHAVLVNRVRVKCQPGCPSPATHVDIPIIGTWMSEEEFKKIKESGDWHS